MPAPHTFIRDAQADDSRTYDDDVLHAGGELQLTEGTRLLPAPQPLVHALFEERERHRATEQDDIVKLLHVERRAELPRRPRAQLLDLQLADLVGERLAGPRDVAVHFVDDVLVGLRRVLAEEC